MGYNFFPEHSSHRQRGVLRIVEYQFVVFAKLYTKLKAAGLTVCYFYDEMVHARTKAVVVVVAGSLVFHSNYTLGVVCPTDFGYNRIFVVIN